MKAARLFSIYFLLAFLVSCNPAPEEDLEIKDGLEDSFVTKEGGEVEPPAPSCYKDVYEAPRESITRKLDILIVPDTSASIKQERKRIAEGFDYFVSALPEGVDFNIGVILGHSGKSNKSGKLYKKNSKDALVLKSSELSLKEIQDALSLKIHNPKTDGSSDGGEMGMYSILEALKDGNLQEIKSKGLLRDDAALAVIFVADEQDICAQAPEGITLKVDPQNGERKSFVKYCIEENLKWKDANIGGSEYTYKIKPQIVLDRLKVVKGEMPLVVGGVLYDEASTIPTGNEDEIGYGYLETVRLAKGINVDLGSGDYRDGLKNLGKLATTSFSAPQSFDLSVNPDETSIKAFVDNNLVPHTYDPLANKVFLVDDRDDLSTARIEYCEKDNVNTPPLISLVASPLEGIAPLEVVVDGSGSTDDKEIESFMLEINGEVLTNSTGLFSYTISEAGEFEALFKAIDNEGAISSESLSFSVAPTPINPIADFTLSKTSGRVPFSTVLDASSSTDIDGTIVKYDLSVNGSVTSQTDPVFNLSFNEAGSVNLLLTVTDSQGLTSEKSATLQVLPALVAPVAAFTITPEEGRIPLDVVIDASDSSDSDGSIVKYDLYIEELLISQSTAIFNLSVTDAKTYNLRLVVTDSSGLTNEVQKSATYLPALIAPVASLSATPSEAEVPFEVTLDASLSTDSDGTIVNYIFSDGTNVVESPSSTLTFVQETPGTYNYTVEIVDNDGLKSTANTQVIAKPKTTDEVSALLAFYKFNLIPSGDAFELELLFEGRSLNGKEITEAYYSTPDGTRVDVGRRVLGHKDVIPFDSTDPVDIKLTVVDELGGSEEFTQTVHSDPALQKPYLSINAIEFGAGELVFFSNQLFDPYNQLGGFASFRLDFGDGQIQEIFDSSFQVNHQYTEAGPYSVTLTAVGENGEEFSSTETIDVIGSSEGYEFPIADFRVEIETWAPGVRLYVDQSLSPLAPIKTYLWNLGDGTTAYGPEVIHFYQAGGYDVTLTAILEDGSQSVVKREVIIMNDAPNIVANIDCADIGNLTLECSVVAVDKFSDLSNINLHFGDSEILPENIVSQSVSGQLAEVVFTHPYQAPGNYSVTYQVQTNRGEELVSNKDYAVTDAPGNLPPITILNCFTFFNQVDCNGYSSYDPDGFIVNYEISLGNGETFTTTDPQFFYEYPENGTFDITLTAFDNFGTSTSTIETVIIEERPNQFPVPQLTCRQENIEELICSASASYDSDGAIIGAKFSEAITGQEFIITNLSQEVLFKFPDTNSYEIKLEVQDNAGSIVGLSNFYEVDGNIPPIAAFICGIDQDNNLFYTCQSTSEDPDGFITTTLFRDSDGNEIFENQITLSRLKLTGGESFDLIATDNEGKASQANISISDIRSDPVANFTYDINRNNLEVDASSFNQNLILPSYEYYFNGDGPFKTNDGQMNYPLSQNGPISIKLIVQDFTGANSEITKEVSGITSQTIDKPRPIYERKYGTIDNQIILKSSNDVPITWQIDDEIIIGSRVILNLQDYREYQIQSGYTNSNGEEIFLEKIKVSFEDFVPSFDQRDYWIGERINLYFPISDATLEEIELFNGVNPVDFELIPNGVSFLALGSSGQNQFLLKVKDYESEFNLSFKEYQVIENPISDYKKFMEGILEEIYPDGGSERNQIYQDLISNRLESFENMDESQIVTENKIVRAFWGDEFLVSKSRLDLSDFIEEEVETTSVEVDLNDLFISKAYAQDEEFNSIKFSEVNKEIAKCRKYLNPNLPNNIKVMKKYLANEERLKDSKAVEEFFELILSYLGASGFSFSTPEHVTAQLNALKFMILNHFAIESSNFNRCTQFLYFPDPNPEIQPEFEFIEHDFSDPSKFQGGRYVFLNYRDVQLSIQGIKFKNLEAYEQNDFNYPFPPVYKTLKKSYDILKETKESLLQSFPFANEGTCIPDGVDIRYLTLGNPKSCKFLSLPISTIGSAKIVFDSVSVSNFTAEDKISLYESISNEGAQITAKRKIKDFTKDINFTFDLKIENTKLGLSTFDLLGGRDIFIKNIKGISKGGCPNDEEVKAFCNNQTIVDAIFGDCSEWGGLISTDTIIDKNAQISIDSSSRICGSTTIEGDQEIDLKDGSLIINGTIKNSTVKLINSKIQNSTLDNVGLEASKGVEIINNSRLENSANITLTNNVSIAGSMLNGGGNFDIKNNTFIADGTKLYPPVLINGDFGRDPTTPIRPLSIKSSTLGKAGTVVQVFGYSNLSQVNCPTIAISNNNKREKIIVTNVTCSKENPLKGSIGIEANNEVSVKLKNSPNLGWVGIIGKSLNVYPSYKLSTPFDIVDQVIIENISGGNETTALSVSGKSISIKDFNTEDSKIRGENILIKENSEVRDFINATGLRLVKSKINSADILTGGLTINDSEVFKIEGKNKFENRAIEPIVLLTGSISTKSNLGEFYFLLDEDYRELNGPYATVRMNNSRFTSFSMVEEYFSKDLHKESSYPRKSLMSIDNILGDISISGYGSNLLNIKTINNLNGSIKTINSEIRNIAMKDSIISLQNSENISNLQFETGGSLKGHEVRIFGTTESPIRIGGDNNLVKSNFLKSNIEGIVSGLTLINSRIESVELSHDLGGKISLVSGYINNLKITGPPSGENFKIECNDRLLSGHTARILNSLKAGTLKLSELPDVNCNIMNLELDQTKNDLFLNGNATSLSLSNSSTLRVGFQSQISTVSLDASILSTYNTFFQENLFIENGVKLTNLNSSQKNCNVSLANGTVATLNGDCISNDEEKRNSIEITNIVEENKEGGAQAKLNFDVRGDDSKAEITSVEGTLTLGMLDHGEISLKSTIGIVNLQTGGIVELESGGIRTSSIKIEEVRNSNILLTDGQTINGPTLKKIDGFFTGGPGQICSLNSSEIEVCNELP